MPINGVKIIDLDSHLVGDVPNWPQWIEEDWKPFLPKKIPTKPQEKTLTLVGKRILVGDPGHFEQDRPDWMRPEDLTVEGRVRNLDKDGIDIAVLSPNSIALSTVWFVDDPELAAAFCRTQNNYMNYYASQAPARLKWAGLIPWQDRDAAIKELHWMAEMGSKGLNMKATPMLGREWSDSYYEPVFRELQALHLPIIFHDTRTGSLGHERFQNNFFFSHMVGRVLETMVCGMVFICGGILEKFPGMKIIMLETGASQFPWWLGRMDEHYEKLGHLVPWLKMEPSEYFKRQAYVGCEPFEDPHFEEAVKLLGDDNLVLATDQPHWDSTTPGGAVKPMLESTRLSERNKQKILGGNAAALMGL
jgi:aminocarboxymuconate-semialdehyde decarboxylase